MSDVWREEGKIHEVRDAAVADAPAIKAATLTVTVDYDSDASLA